MFGGMRVTGAITNMEKVHESILGAKAALPVSKCRPKDKRCLERVFLSTCFVRMSEVFSDPGTFLKPKSLVLSLSWTQRSAVARCLIRPRPLLRHMPIAAVASVLIIKVHERPKSFATVCNPSAVDAPRQIPFSSASAELRVTVVWVELQCLIRWRPRRHTPPDVDLLVDKQPAKSVSTATSSW